MLNWVIRENTSTTAMFNAGSKARNDIESILSEKGAEIFFLDCSISKEENRAKRALAMLSQKKKIIRALNKIASGDTVTFQFPTNSRLFYLTSIIKHLNSRGIKTQVLIHDLESLRFANSSNRSSWYKRRVTLEESALKHFSSVVAHNEKMADYLVTNKGVSREKVIPLQIFDYLAKDPDMLDSLPFPNENSWRVAIAGNLNPNKSPYIQLLPDTPVFNLYGIGYEENSEKKNQEYFGAFLPEELPNKLQAHFGLVWDGTSIDTCNGVTGNYLRYNNPHKTSLYLCSGIPVVIWKEAAMAKFVSNNNCGILIESLKELENKLREIDEHQFKQMQENAKRIGHQLRSGHYTTTALTNSRR